MREHLIYPAIYAAVKALPLDDEGFERFYRIRDLLTLLRDNRSVRGSDMNFVSKATLMAAYCSNHENGRDSRHYRSERARFLSTFAHYA